MLLTAANNEGNDLFFFARRYMALFFPWDFWKHWEMIAEGHESLEIVQTALN
jgi:hypothetical protein